MLNTQSRQQNKFTQGIVWIMFANGSQSTLSIANWCTWLHAQAALPRQNRLKSLNAHKLSLKEKKKNNSKSKEKGKKSHWDETTTETTKHETKSMRKNCQRIGTTKSFRHFSRLLRFRLVFPHFRLYFIEFNFSDFRFWPLFYFYFIRREIWLEFCADKK